MNRFVIVIVTVLGFGSQSFGGEPYNLTAILRMPKDPLPVNGENDFRGLERNHKGIALVGAGTQWATGFCISKEMGLVVTNCHVAEIAQDYAQVYVIGVGPDGKDRHFKVKKIWYHPWQMRQAPNGQRILSTNKKDGTLILERDVAVLQIDGKLADDLPLMSPLDVHNIGMWIGKVTVVGMPPAPGDWKTQGATLVSGNLNNLFSVEQGSNRDKVPFILASHTIPGVRPGFSGSPVVSSKTGKVFSIISSSDDKFQFSKSVSVTAVWELLAIVATDLLYGENSKEAENTRLAVETTLIGEGSVSQGGFEYLTDAVERARVSIETAPAYWSGYRLRHLAEKQLHEHHHTKGTFEKSDCDKIAKQVNDDLKRVSLLTVGE